MPIRAREGTCLEALVRMAVPVCRLAQSECPRSGPRRKPEIPDWVMAVLIAVAVAKRRKTKSAQYRYLRLHRSRLLKLIGTRRFPSRSTYFDRYRRAHSLLQVALIVHTRRQLRQGQINVECVAADKSLIDARGPLWHGQQRRRDVRP